MAKQYVYPRVHTTSMHDDDDDDDGCVGGSSVSGWLARARVHAPRWTTGASDGFNVDGFAVGVDGGGGRARRRRHPWAHSRIQGAVSRGSGRVLRGGVCARGTREREREWCCGGGERKGVRDVASGVRRGVSEELGGTL